MPLSRLKVNQFRNLSLVDLQFSPDINLIYGHNGSGKTSLLESIFVLGLGRSFRGHKIKPLINETAEQLVVHGKSEDWVIGVARPRRGASQFKVNGTAVTSLAELTKTFPAVVINSDTFQLLAGGPKERRQFLDWLVFHVEPSFYPSWKGAARCLKQRNIMLRHGRMSYGEVAPWDRELVEHTEQLTKLRVDCFERFKETFLALVEEFIAVDSLTLSYWPGWNAAEGSLAQLLTNKFEVDCARGHTTNGFHRADLKLKIGKQEASEVLSRGQQKLMVCALMLAKCLVYQEATSRKIVILVDDLPSELDDYHQKLLVDWLNKLNCQVFVTGVDKQALLNPWGEYPERQIAVFHVEHGNINQSE